MSAIRQVREARGLVRTPPLTRLHLTVVVAFPLVDDPETSLIAWTTTPWTLPSNLTLCVHPDFTYIKIHDETSGKNYILHEKLLGTLYKDVKKAKFKKLDTFLGKSMKGWRYVPLFDYFVEKVLYQSP
jgi:isoleucyl-tRNA synthetase